MPRAILLVSHGSRSKEARREVEALARRLRGRSGFRFVQCAFLDVEKPAIPEGIEACVRRGASVVIVLLNFLNSGDHVQKDIPAIVSRARRRHPGVIFRLTPPIGLHPRFPGLFAGIARTAGRRAS